MIEIRPIKLSEADEFHIVVLKPFGIPLVQPRAIHDKIILNQTSDECGHFHLTCFRGRLFDFSHAPLLQAEIANVLLAFGNGCLLPTAICGVT